MAAGIRSLVKDDRGITFDPASLPHSFAYDTNGNMLTDTCIEQGSIVRVKTFTYAQVNGMWLMQTESVWVNETENFRV